MFQPLEETKEVAKAWCGRSWEGLVDRRYEAFEHALALKRATERDSHRVTTEFLHFFDEVGAELMRDEEEWIFRSLTPVPDAVITALQDHIEITSSIQSLFRDAQAGRVEVRELHRLGALLERHLLAEEEEVRPLATQRPRLIMAR